MLSTSLNLDISMVYKYKWNVPHSATQIVHRIGGALPETLSNFTYYAPDEVCVDRK